MGFLWQLLAAAAIFAVLLEKRPRWPLRLAAAVGVCAVYSGITGFLLGRAMTILPMPASSLAGLVVVSGLLCLLPQLALAGLVLWLVCRVSVPEALLGALCAYATEHFVYAAGCFFWPEQVSAELLGQAIPWHWGQLALAAAVYLVFYFRFARRLVQNGHFLAPARHVMTGLALILLIAVVLSLWAKLCYAADGGSVFRVCQLYDMVCCYFVLWMQTAWRREQTLQTTVETERQLRRQQQAQYRLSRASIAAINRKCHDLKHQLAALRVTGDEGRRTAVLDGLERDVMVYDSGMRTGNEVLDTVLTEKSLLCEQAGVRWTCMADGAALAFMDPVDLYTLLGNALDNAMESARRLPDPERRVLTVTLRRQREMAFLQIENYCAETPRFVNGVPVTTKPDPENHGFGVRSMEEIVRRYGGTMELSAADGVFLVSILLPIPPQEA